MVMGSASPVSFSAIVSLASRAHSLRPADRSWASAAPSRCALRFEISAEQIQSRATRGSGYAGEGIVGAQHIGDFFLDDSALPQAPFANLHGKLIERPPFRNF